MPPDKTPVGTKHGGKSCTELEILEKIFLLKQYFEDDANLDNINKYVDRSIDSQHEVVPPGQDLCPGWPDHQLPVVNHLVSLISVGDQLGGVTAEEHHHYGGEKGGHGCVTAVVGGYGVVEHGGSGSENCKIA